MPGQLSTEDILRWLRSQREHPNAILAVEGTPWESPIKRLLEEDANKEIKAVIITHSETSTGVINDLKSINKEVKNHGKAIKTICSAKVISSTQNIGLILL